MSLYRKYGGTNIHLAGEGKKISAEGGRSFYGCLGQVHLENVQI